MSDKQHTRQVVSGATQRKNNNIGYGKPPEHSRFKKGTSGNPGGRPRQNREHLRSLISVLAEPIIVQEGGKKRKTTKYEALLSVYVNKALKGDHRALHAILKMAPRSEIRGYLHQRGKADPARPVTQEEAIAEYMKMIALSGDV